MAPQLDRATCPRRLQSVPAPIAGVAAAALALLLSVAPASLAAQRGVERDTVATPSSREYSVSAMWMAPLSGPQANPFNDPVPGSLLSSPALEGAVRVPVGRHRVTALLGWSQHPHRIGEGGLKLTGRSNWARGLLQLRVRGSDSSRLQFDTGVGLLHSRSTSNLIRAGDEIGLIGATAGVRVIETSMLVSAGTRVRLRQVGSIRTSLRAAIEYAPTQDAATLMVPISLQLSR